MIFLLAQPYPLGASSLSNHTYNIYGSGNSEGVQSLNDVELWKWRSPHLLNFRSTLGDTSIILQAHPQFPVLFIEKGMRQ